MELTSEMLSMQQDYMLLKFQTCCYQRKDNYQGYFAKGNYFSYLPTTSIGKITDVLIYPCPNPNASSLGTH